MVKVNKIQKDTNLKDNFTKVINVMEYLNGKIKNSNRIFIQVTSILKISFIEKEFYLIHMELIRANLLMVKNRVKEYINIIMV